MKSDESRRENSSRPIAVDDSAVAVTPVPRQGDTPPHPSCFRERGQVAPDDDRYRYFNPAERETAQRLEVLYPSVSLVSINAMDGVYGKTPDALAGGRAVELKRVSDTAQPVTAVVKQVRRSLGQTGDLVVVDATVSLLTREDALRALTLSAERYGSVVREILIIYSAQAEVAAVGWAREQ